MQSLERFIVIGPKGFVGVYKFERAACRRAFILCSKGQKKDKYQVMLDKNPNTDSPPVTVAIFNLVDASIIYEGGKGLVVAEHRRSKTGTWIWHKVDEKKF